MLYKPTYFDQECGCVAIIEINGNRVDFYNVYGDLSKYLQNPNRKPVVGSPGFRKKFLQNFGFLRARGQRVFSERVDELVFDSLCRDYKDVSKIEIHEPALVGV
jgi:hypothetical protein